MRLYLWCVVDPEVDVLRADPVVLPGALPVLRRDHPEQKVAARLDGDVETGPVPVDLLCHLKYEDV